jgi:hypothetical protein
MVQWVRLTEFRKQEEKVVVVVVVVGIATTGSAFWIIRHVWIAG